jgi:hypothetical protein
MLFSLRRSPAHRARLSRARRVKRLIPRPPEDLESRDVPAAGPLGLNLSSMGYVDLMKEPNSNWGAIGSETFSLDSLGNPTNDAYITVLDERVNQPWNGPDPNASQPDIGGTYHLSFHGQATITPPSWLQIFTVQNQTYNPSTNVTTADLVVPHNVEAFLQLNFLGTKNPESATGAGISDVHLIQPGYAADTTQLFTNDFLNALKPFGTLRYLDIAQANNFGPQNNNDAPLNWSQRRLPDEASQTDTSYGKWGESWEYMIALANATNTDMWITVPGTATDDYVTQLANLIKNGDTVNGVTYAGLNPNLKVYVEYSNEVWGGIYNTYASNFAAAQAEVAAGGSALNNDGSTDTTSWADRRYLERSMQIGNIFRGVFGGDPNYNKIRPVLGWQEDNWQYYTQYFPWFQSSFGAPSQFFYGMGNAIYLNPTDTSSPDAIINSMVAAEASSFASMQKFTAVADFYGLKNVSYEGGPALIGSGTPLSTNLLAASRDPRMEAVVSQHYLDFYAAGGDVANYFNGPYNIWAAQYGIWDAAELSQASNPSLSPKYRGLQDVANAAPQAPAAGTAVSATGATSLPVNADTLGQSFTLPHTGDNNYWLLNVATAGSYDLQLTTGVNGDLASRYAPGQVEVELANQQVIGTSSVQQAGVFDLGAVPLHAGLNVLVIHTVHGSFDPSDTSYGYRYEFNPTNLTIQPAIRTSSQASFAGSDTTTQGNWRSAYGADGYSISQDASIPNPVIPSYASVSMPNALQVAWTTSTADPRALQNAAGTGRLAATWYPTTPDAGSSFDIDVNLSDGNSHRVSIYALDWDFNGARSERFDVINAATGAVMDSRTISSFQNGEYLSWNLQGSVIIRVTNLAAGLNAVVSGIFFG